MPKWIVKHRVVILIVSLILLIPALFGFINTRVNYDLLTYLPSDIDTMVGQEKLKEEFGTGGFSMIVFDGATDETIREERAQIEQVEHVKTALWYDESEIGVPAEFLPSDFYNVIHAKNGKDESVMVVLFDTGTSEDATLDAVSQIKGIIGDHAFMSGMSALVADLKELVQSEQMIYVAIATVLAILAMLIFLDNWLTPFVFIASIGIMILINMGTNIFIGEISFVTMALSAVLQLAVTMDYSIFLWHSYKEEQEHIRAKMGLEANATLSMKNREQAMAVAIKKTFRSVIGSSITTVAGFIALMFMTFTLGFDLGLVMAKGVVLGVIGSVTVLPAMILVFNKWLEKANHKSILPDMTKFSRGLLKIFPVIVLAFVAIIPPAFTLYQQANSETYYNLGSSLPDDMSYVIANTKLEEDFDAGLTDIALISTKTSESDTRKMLDEISKTDGVKYVLGLESLIGERIPEEMVPESVMNVVKSDNYELVLIGSEYEKATDEANAQANSLSETMKKYDSEALLVGEGPATKDMIELMDRDFKIVNAISIVAIFIIIAIVEKSISLPFILIAVIEVAIFINLGISHLTGTSLPFIAPICISTIQLGATVDYAILMTTRYKAERIGGKNKHDAIQIALSTSIPSIIVSSAGLFVATLGVAIYSNMDMISSICLLLARGAVISMAMVILVLPALLMLCDKLICKTTKEMKPCLKN